MIEASSWDLGLEAGIWALRLGFESGRGGTDGEGGKIFPICESIGHRPLWGRCPKTRLDTWLPMSHGGGQRPYLRSLDH